MPSATATDARSLLAVSLFRRAGERRGTPADVLVIGLANTESQYEGTRHNVGAEVIDELAERHGGRLKASRKERALVDTVQMAGRRVVLAVPTTYVNLSGEAARELVRRHGVTEAARVVVVHDELDLPVGRMKVKLGGGTAGHNGLRSITAHLGSDGYGRVRVGVGKPPSARAGKDYVLHRPGKSERAELDAVVTRAADAVEVYVADGGAEAMNRFNRA
jgi:PTH1 family peptidyl-tRNA hydrolase